MALQAKPLSSTDAEANFVDIGGINVKALFRRSVITEGLLHMSLLFTLTGTDTTQGRPRQRQ